MSSIWRMALRYTFTFQVLKKNFFFNFVRTQLTCFWKLPENQLCVLVSTNVCSLHKFQDLKNIKFSDTNTTMGYSPDSKTLKKNKNQKPMSSPGIMGFQNLGSSESSQQGTLSSTLAVAAEPAKSTSGPN